MKKKNATKRKSAAAVGCTAWLGQSVNDWPRAALLALPHRKWDDESPRYESLLIVSTGKKHDSGWAMMAIIGCRKQKPVEICTSGSDDIEWKMPAAIKYGGGEYTLGQYRSDMAIKSGALHVWTREGKFRVGASLSSTEIELCPNDRGEP
jgi:hypothetical protein